MAFVVIGNFSEGMSKFTYFNAYYLYKSKYKVE